MHITGMQGKNMPAVSSTSIALARHWVYVTKALIIEYSWKGSLLSWPALCYLAVAVGLSSGLLRPHTVTLPGMRLP